MENEYGVPSIRIRAANRAPIDGAGDYVLYWMIASRRLHYNFGLQLAAGHARSLGRPLLVLEALRAGYRWASDRLHAFALAGMADHAEAARQQGFAHYAYVEPAHGEGRGLLEALARRACLIVTDEYPCFFLPRMVEAAAERVPVSMLVVDSNGLLPLRASPKAFTAAVHLRRFLQRSLPPHLEEFPDAAPLRRGLPEAHAVPVTIAQRWPPADQALLKGDPEALAALTIDHAVPPVPSRGGARAARAALRRFLKNGIAQYATHRNDPDVATTSGLSPYLHWGHISVHQVFHEIAGRESWDPSDLSTRATGSKAGWWNMSADAEAFLDQLVTWRELGFNTCLHVPDYDNYGSLPVWARATLADHSADPRPHLYDLDTFETADTHDPLWNAAQRQLRREGHIHNYLRMLWGKKILEWSASPEEALETMVELNNRWAVDGRDPNSWAGIMWVLGRYDRGWPERAVYGKVRSMSSDATRRKCKLDEYLAEFGPA